MSEQYKLIRTIQYNDIQSKISNVLGTGSNDYGYGQPVLSSQVALGAKISSNQWSNLRTDILKARQHQTGLNETLTTPTTSTTIKDSDRQAYLDMAVLCETNRTVVPPTSQATRTNLITGQYTNAWNGTLIHTVTITFESAEAMRYYFNTGSVFDITANRTGGTTGAKNASWTTMLTNIGTLRFGRYNTTRIDTNNNISTVSNIGYTGLSTSVQQLYIKLTENTTYTPNAYRLSVSTNQNGTKIIFEMVFEDLAGIDDLFLGVDEIIDGTTRSVVESYRATGNNVSVILPGVSDTFISTNTGSEIASLPVITPDITLMNEGQTVIFTVNTIGAPNGTTLYWTTFGTVTATDFTDNQDSGSVVINNNTGSISRTLVNDLMTEGTETFGLNIHEYSSSGPTLSTSATITIQDTSVPLPTCTVTPNITTVSEGMNVIFTVNTEYVANGTTLFWGIQAGPGITGEDFFATPHLSGSFIITNNTASITIPILLDTVSESTEQFSLQIFTDTNGTTFGLPSENVYISPNGVYSWNYPGSYTWVVPAGVTSVQLDLIGGGGSGTNWVGEHGRPGSSNQRGMPGNTVSTAISLTPGEIVNITVGAAGYDSDPGWSIGGSGGNSIFSCTAGTYTATGGLYGDGINGSAGSLNPSTFIWGTTIGEGGTGLNSQNSYGSYGATPGAVYIRIRQTVVFSTAGATSWMVPSGVQSATATIYGGGGGASNAYWSGGRDNYYGGYVGGGAAGSNGQIITQTISVIPGSTLTGTVGKGGDQAYDYGRGGPNNGHPGYPGQNSEFNSIVANGGAGGVWGGSPTAPAQIYGKGGDAISSRYGQNLPGNPGAIVINF